MQILYFSWIREQLGKAEEEITKPDSAETVADMLDHLMTLDASYEETFRHRVTLRAALNQEHVDLDAKLTDADELALFPPITGG